MSTPKQMLRWTKPKLVKEITRLQLENGILRDSASAMRPTEAIEAAEAVQPITRAELEAVAAMAGEALQRAEMAYSIAGDKRTWWHIW